MFKNITSIFLLLCSSHLAYGWGSKGHQVVAYVGANIATDGEAFWKANLEPLRQLTTVPDRVWKAPATKDGEANTHWFQVDAYYQPSDYNQIIRFPSNYSDAITQYGSRMIEINGVAPWRIRQLYQLAFYSLTHGDMKQGLEYVGVMTHYIGDISQPLHVSENYDGQQTGNKGIHSYFETTIITDEIKIRADVEKRALALLQDANFLSQFNGNLMDTILLEVERSISNRDLVLENDKKYGRSKSGASIQLNLAKDRMADAAATTALILNQLWRDTGLVAKATPMTIQDPNWVKPDFNNLPKDRMSPIHRKFLSDEEDCSL
ncbi:hypothetical protein CIK05_01245 [Bdellovibrio sp. qaytius]|nr:hypothetical protein CIK05_01245 [Bdellovibrio sp. qaytius]